MTTVTQLTAEIERHQQEFIRLVTALREQIENLPDNPRVRRVYGGRGFVVRFSDLDKWSVEHQDFKMQYNAIAKNMEKSPERAVEILKNAVATGKVIPHGGSFNSTIHLHSDVVAYLKTLLAD
jgi:hypothetical protein